MATVTASPPTLFSLAGAKEFVSKLMANWGEDNVPRLAAAFTFYAMLSLAPLLVLLVTIGAWFLGRSQANQTAIEYVGRVVNPQAATFVSSIIGSAQRPAAGITATLLSLVVAFYGASGLFVQLRDTVNTIWDVAPEPTSFGSVLKTRVLAFLGVLVFGALILAWLVLDSWLGWLARQANGFPGWPLVSFLFALVFLGGLFAVSIKAMPKHQVAWSDVFVGAGVAALGVALFKLLLSQYLVGASTTSAYGAAGSLVAILLWFYYTSMVYFFGVETTYTYTHLYGSRKDKSRPPPVTAPLDQTS